MHIYLYIFLLIENNTNGGIKMNYESVPNIITGKDLDYLSDMFNWNYGSYKCTVNAIDKVNDEEIRNLLVSATDMFYENMNVVLNILNNEVNNEQ